MLLQLINLVALVASSYLSQTPPAISTSAFVNSASAQITVQNSNQQILGATLNKQVAENYPKLKNSKALGVKISAQAAIVLDRATGKILYARNIDKPLPEASLTKIMTAVTVLDQIKNDDIATITKDPLKIQPEGAHMRLVPGEKISVFNLLRGLLMGSANDAAIALSDYVSENEKKFVTLMNQKAKNLGLQNTQFQNTHGLDEPNHYSSARDLAQIMRYALDKKLFREIIQTKTFSFTSSVRTRFLGNTNKLLNDPYLNIQGGKTGFTDNAGHCLIEVAKNSQGKEIITVVLASSDSWRDSKNLIYWTFRNYQW